ncbi:hypothetical protein CXG81DRAFT_23267 [Caulochytrium protostelioides]|uniref:peptidyl-tRNA hydrolase n=1 Tax=Caulochytrium protostelioides TaxID=1555241 RepID=A0A4P9XFZ9_9FUNG|nr:hypothetical protein CXG81DRAFT_23267 [Caulochytrium protostelioides]|eukprot:RKP04161.1 hypothetical protein CXG81DRAFT_23267 [Caulochytrium protostelioides]
MQDTLRPLRDVAAALAAETHAALARIGTLTPFQRQMLLTFAMLICFLAYRLGRRAGSAAAVSRLVSAGTPLARAAGADAAARVSAPAPTDARIKEALSVLRLVRDGISSRRPSTKIAHRMYGRQYKMVFIVRGDLGMGKGKIAAQVGHACLGAYKNALAYDPEANAIWEKRGQMKVVLRGNGEEELFEKQAEARALGLITELICDAGRTQIAESTYTVLAIGPGPPELIDKVAGSFKLL